MRLHGVSTLFTLSLAVALSGCPDDGDSDSSNSADAGTSESSTGGGVAGKGQTGGAGGKVSQAGTGGKASGGNGSAGGKGGSGGKGGAAGSSDAGTADAGHGGTGGASGNDDDDAGVAAVDVSPEVQAAADAAFQYGYPLTEVMRVCDNLDEVNKPYSRSTLSTPADKMIVLPNNDTFYTVACLYVADGWVKLTMPAPNGRYMSAEIFDAYTNNVGLASARDIPEAGQEYVLLRQGASREGIPEGLPVIEIPTPFGYMLARTLVDGPNDVAAATAAQSGIALTPSSTTQPDRTVDLTSSTKAQDFFLKLNLRLHQNPPPKSEEATVLDFRKAGVRAEAKPKLEDVSPQQLAAWENAYAKGFDAIDASAMKLNDVRGQWAWPNPNSATPGTNYALRAEVARYGIFPLPPTESLYPRTQGDGNTPKVLTLPSDWPPTVKPGFWSLTMYADGYLVDNPINRYSIGDRTEGVKKEEDGSLKIYIQCKDPGGDLTANWLPAPCGPYSITMRLYLPTEAAQDPSFTVPPLQ